MTEAKINLSIDGVKTVVSGFQEVGDRVGDLMGKMTALTAIGGTLSLAAFASMVTAAAESAAGLHDLSVQTGATVEALSGLAEIGKYSDISAEQIGGAMNKLAKNMAVATEESKGVGKALQALGINFNDFKRLSPDQQMLTLAKAMDQFEDGSGKAAVAMTLYGKEGAKMLPFMKDLAAAGEIQAKITTAQADASDNFSDNLTKVQTSGSAWKKELAMGLIPAMSDLSDAWLDATNGSGGLREKVRELGNDGTLERWARGGVTVLSYLLDVGQGLFSLFPMLGKAIGGVVASTATGFSSIYEAWVRFQNFDLDGAFNALKSGGVGIKTIMRETAADVAGIWNQELLGERIRKSMDAARDARLQMNKDNKSQLNFSADDDDDGGKKGKAVSEYERLMASIREKTTLQEMEAQTVDKLTDGEKMAAKVMTDLRDNKLKLVAVGNLSIEQQKIALTQALETLIASEKANEQKREEAKATLAALEARSKYVETLATGLDKLKADSLAQSEHNARIGLTKDAIAALDAAKLEEQATTLDGIAIKRLDKDLDEGVYNLYKAQAEELRKIARLKREGSLKEMVVEEQKKAADEAQKIWDNFGENVQRNVGDVLYNAFQGKFDGIGASFRALLNRMIADALAAKLSEAMFGAKGSGSGGWAEALINVGAALFGSNLTVDANGQGIVSDTATYSATGEQVRGRRAGGGAVDAGGLYQVNELGPELLSVGGKDYLMMGSQGGQVTPNDQLGGRSVVVNLKQTVNIDSRSDRAAIASDMARLKEQTKAELMDTFDRQGGF